MQWFLERINAQHLPISFGIADNRAHPRDFAKLVKLGVLKHTGNLDSVPCDLCDEDHESMVREKDGGLSYICEYGGGKQVLTGEDLVIYEYDNAAFLKLLARELGISPTSGTASDEAAYTQDSFFCIGPYQIGTFPADAYYLRTDTAYEASALFERIGNSPKILITNTARPSMVSGKDGVRYVVLADILASSSVRLFDASALKKSLGAARRVRFDQQQAHLLLDDTRVYSAALGSPEYYFLLCLWNNWQRQTPHDTIYDFVRSELGRGFADTPSKFCGKTKNKIKQKFAKIDDIITIPTSGRYMMADPLA